MDGQDPLTDRFEQHRPRLRALAYRMLGSLSEADDAVQDAWLRANRADTGLVEDWGAWLTRVVARVCLNVLRSREQRREDSLELRMPDPVLGDGDSSDPEQEALVAEAVGLALMVVLDTLAPAERLAFVLHDLFGVPFEEIAPLLERSPPAARQLASRARRRVRGQAPSPDPDLTRQREVVDAFFAAARNGDFVALVALLHPDVVFRAEGLARTGQSFVIAGAREVARQAGSFGPLAPKPHAVLVNGAVGVVVVDEGKLISVTGFTVAGGKIVTIDVLADPQRLQRLGAQPWKFGVI